MQFSEEVDWDLFDFIIAAILLFGTGFIIEFVLRKVKTTQKRLLYCGIVLAVLFLVWAELAVGIFGSPFAGS
jgi:CHASE2 domain-containing sensor protein